MTFYASFNRFNDLSQGSFDGTIESLGDTDNWEDSADVDPTGLENDLDAMEEANVIDEDDEADEVTEDLDMDDIEPGEDLDEDMLNEVDLDTEDISENEPDWEPVEDAADIPDVETDISEEDDDSDTQMNDAPYDEWDEVTPDAEIEQFDDISEEDDIWLGEEVGFDEPLFYPDDEDTNTDPTNDAIEDIEFIEHLDDITDNAVDEIELPGQELLGSASWVDNLETFLDFTDQDVSSFHEVSEGYEMEDGYDPPYFPDEGVDLLELSNFVDDVFANIFDGPDMGDSFFSWFDSFE